MHLRSFKPFSEVSSLTLGGGGIGQVWGKTSAEEAIQTVQTALDYGINHFDVAPMYGKGEAERVIRRQIDQGLEGIDVKRLIVAYEPIWAIGTGKTCEANEANRICGLIRKWTGYEDVIIQYGGSVKSNNIDEIMSMSDIDGVLVGGASLDPTNFARIANYETK